MGEERMVKSNFRMKITTLKREGNENSESLKVIDEKWIRCRGKDFQKSLYEDKVNGIEHKVEIVKAAPENFQINTIYVRADGEVVWVFKEENI